MAVGTPYSVAADASVVTSSTDASITTNALAHAGDTLFVVVAQRLTAAAIISTVTGHGSTNTPEIVSYKPPSGFRGISAYRIKLTSDIPSGTLLTVTLDNSTTRKMVAAFCVPGLDDHNAITSGGVEGATGNPTTPSLSHTLTDGIAIAFFEHDDTANGTGRGTPGTGYTEIADRSIGGSSWCGGYVEYKKLTAASTEQPSYTPTVNTTTYEALLGIWQGVPSGTTYSLPTGHIASSEAVRGVALTDTIPLAVGKIASPAAVRGLALQMTGGLPIGKIGSSEAVRGLTVGSVITLPTGHIASAEAVRGVSLPVTVPLSVGKIPTGEAVRGLTLAATIALGLGKIASPAAVRGLALPIVTALPVGKIPSGAAVRGLILSDGVTIKPSLYVLVPLYTTGVSLSTFTAREEVPVGYFNTAVESATPREPVEIGSFPQEVEF